MPDQLFPHRNHPQMLQGKDSSFSYRLFVSKRVRRLTLLLTFILVLFSAPKAWQYFTIDRTPPLFSSYHLSEWALPQHDLDLSFPEGRNGKYLWISAHWHGAGFGNILQEHIMNGLLAYNSGRSFVFDNYTWSKEMPYSEFNGHLIPSQIPMSAFLSGPLAGGPFEPGDKTPRPVMKKYYDLACPNSTKLSIPSSLAAEPYQFSGATAMKAWLQAIDETPDRCIEITENVFDLWIFGSSRLADALPALFESPIISLFRWSPLVNRAFQQNAGLLVEHGRPRLSSSDPHAPIPGLLALHIRRGDFEAHCEHLAKWRAEWGSFNQIPGLLDKWVKPPADEEGLGLPEDRPAHALHCYPSIEQIVRRIEEIRQTEDGKQLWNIFIMTNGKPDWVNELKTAIRAQGQWGRIESSRDMTLTWEQKHVSAAVDMLIGQKADVFIGNGWSTLTGNVVMLRMARGLSPGRTRFW